MAVYSANEIRTFFQYTPIMMIVKVQAHSTVNTLNILYGNWHMIRPLCSPPKKTRREEGEVHLGLKSPRLKLCIIGKRAEEYENSTHYLVLYYTILAARLAIYEIAFALLS